MTDFGSGVAPAETIEFVIPEPQSTRKGQPVNGFAPGSNRKLLGHGSVYAISTVAPTLVAALITPILTRKLGSDQYGLVAIALSVLQIGQTLLAVGLPASLSRHVLIERTGSRGASGQVVTCAVLGVVVVAFGLPVMALLQAGNQHATSAEVIALAVMCSAPLATSNCVQAVTLGQGAPRQFVGQALAISFFPQLCGLAVLFSATSSATHYLWGLLAGHLAVAIVLLTILVRRFPPVISRADFARGARIGLPTVPHQLAGTAVPAGLVMIAGARAGVSGAGELQLALLVGTAPMMFLSALNNSWAMQAYAASDISRANFLSHSARAVSVIAVILSLGAGILAPLALTWLANDQMDLGAMTLGACLAASACPVAVLYLANIHQVFASGLTGPLAFTTPAAALIALTTGLAVTSRWPGQTVVVLSATIILFQIMQAFFGRLLRRRTGMRRLDLGWSITAVFVGFLGAAIVMTLPPLPVLRILLAAMLAAAFAAFAIQTMRADDSDASLSKDRAH